MDWESTVGGWATTLVDAAAEKYTNTNTSLNLAQEGQRVNLNTGTLAGFPTSTVLLIGGGIVLFMMLRD